MKRHWGQVGIRAASVGLLVAGTIGGIYLGKDRQVQQQDQQAQLVYQANVDEIELMKERHSEHAAARAYQRQAEGEAATKAASEAQAAAGKARTLEKKVIAEEEAKKEAEEKAKKEAEAKASGTVAYTGEIPASCSEYSGNRETGCALMVDAGFGIDQFPCLDKLWKKESGWNHKARNASSGAYGIPQALPGSKMASIADDWETNPATQIKWGLGYIEGRYSTPCGAWSHSQSTGWY